MTKHLSDNTNKKRKTFPSLILPPKLTFLPVTMHSATLLRCVDSLFITVRAMPYNNIPHHSFNLATTREELLLQRDAIMHSICQHMSRLNGCNDVNCARQPEINKKKGSGNSAAVLLLLLLPLPSPPPPPPSLHITPKTTAILLLLLLQHTIPMMNGKKLRSKCNLHSHITTSFSYFSHIILLRGGSCGGNG